MSREPYENIPTAQKRDVGAERIRLLEHQLDYVRAEMLHLLHEREKMVYSASWRVFWPLRSLEAKLVTNVTGFFHRFRKAEPSQTLATTEPFLQSRQTAPARRLLVDVTGTVKWDAGTGIQRVVKKVTQALYQSGDLEIPALAVRCESGRLFTCHQFVASLTGHPDGTPDREISIESGDRFLMLSDSWNAFEEFNPIFERIRSGGGEIISCIFDLIPALYPHACHEMTVPLYDAWLSKGLLESDSFIAISRTVADELANFVEKRGLPHRPGLKIGWFHCGSDITGGPSSEAREKVKAVVAGDAPVFLSVGTIEPRKEQRTVMRAFEQLWGEGLDLRLIFVGRRGWHDEAVVAEITGHPEYGKRLHWFDDVKDGELSFLYDKASLILVPPYAEGFGLPIVEAARHGRPVICSDIPVFHEVGGDGVAYFRVGDPQALAQCVRDWLVGDVQTDPGKVLCASWADAARRILRVVAREEWSRRLP
jgi:glycosyltransferase involved in cell wall biosynthesis